MKKLSRRTVLRGAGTAIALPMLEAMAPARAAAESAPLRTVFFYVPNGVHMPDWRPSSVGRNFEMPKTLAQLEKHRNKLSVLTNLALDGAKSHGDGPGDHARSCAAFLTGAHPKKTDGADIRNGVSIDQAIAQTMGGKTRFPSLELGLEAAKQSGGCDSGYSCAYQYNLSWRNATSPVALERDPAAVFERLFSSVKGETESSKQSRRSSRRSVLDFALEDAKSLNQRLGASDRRKLDEYLYAVREIENRLVNSEKLSVGEGGVPNYPKPSGVPKDRTEHCRLILDMMVLALRTDSTRISTMMFAKEGSNWNYPNLGIQEAHHGLSHHGKSPEKQQKIAKINRYHIEQLHYLLTALDSVSESGETLLDNTLVVYGSGISDGDRHNHDDLPIILAGGTSRVKQGRHVEYKRQTPLCNLYLWLLRQHGTRADSFGDSNDTLDQLS
jgi:hypothetical protein